MSRCELSRDLPALHRLDPRRFRDVGVDPVLVGIQRYVVPSGDGLVDTQVHDDRWHLPDVGVDQVDNVVEVGGDAAPDAWIF